MGSSSSKPYKAPKSSKPFKSKTSRKIAKSSKTGPRAGLNWRQGARLRFPPLPPHPTPSRPIGYDEIKQRHDLFFPPNQKLATVHQPTTWKQPPAPMHPPQQSKSKPAATVSKAQYQFQPPSDIGRGPPTRKQPTRPIPIPAPPPQQSKTMPAAKHKAPYQFQPLNDIGRQSQGKSNLKSQPTKSSANEYPSYPPRQGGDYRNRARK